MKEGGYPVGVRASHPLYPKARRIRGTIELALDNGEYIRIFGGPATRVQALKAAFKYARDNNINIIKVEEHQSHASDSKS